MDPGPAVSVVAIDVVTTVDVVVAVADELVVVAAVEAVVVGTLAFVVVVVESTRSAVVVVATVPLGGLVSKSVARGRRDVVVTEVRSRSEVVVVVVSARVGFPPPVTLARVVVRDPAVSHWAQIKTHVPQEGDVLSSIAELKLKFPPAVRKQPATLLGLFFKFDVVSCWPSSAAAASHSSWVVMVQYPLSTQTPPPATLT